MISDKKQKSVKFTKISRVIWHDISKGLIYAKTRLPEDKFHHGEIVKLVVTKVKTKR